MSALKPYSNLENSVSRTFLAMGSILAVGVSSVTLVTPSYANSGSVTFTGSVTAPTCTVAGSAGAAGSGTGITVGMGDVPIDEIVPGNWVGAHSRSFVLTVTCPGDLGYQYARTTFNAAAGSGIDPQDTRMVRLTAGGAEGVAVGIYVAGSYPPVDMTGSPSIRTAFTGTGPTVAVMNLRAQYKRTTAAPKAGTASATLPFTLSYE